MDSATLFGSSYSTPEVAARSGLTARQLAWLEEHGALTPSVPAHGSGHHRRWSESDVARARFAGALRHLGATSECIAVALGQLPVDPEAWPAFAFVSPEGVLREFAPAGASWYGLALGRLLHAA